MKKEEFMRYLKSKEGANINDDTCLFPENDKNPFYVQTNCTILSCLHIISTMSFFPKKMMMMI